MQKLDDEKLLPDIQFLGTKKKETRKKDSGDTPAEEPEPVEEDKDDEQGHVSKSSSDSESSSDSDSEDEYKCDICNRKISGYLSYKQHLKGKQHAKAVSRKKKEKKMLKLGNLEKLEQDDEDDDLLEQESYAVCKTCSKEFSGFEPYQAHLKSKTHKRKVFEQCLLEEAKENGEINLDKLAELYKGKRSTNDKAEDLSTEKLKSEEEYLNDEFQCKECGNSFSGLKPFAQHMGSKSHAKQVEKKKLLEKVIKNPDTSGSGESSRKPNISDMGTLAIEDDILVCKICTVSFSGPENAIMHVKSKCHTKKLEKYIRKLEKKKKMKEMENNLMESLCSFIGKSFEEVEPGHAKESEDKDNETKNQVNVNTTGEPSTSSDALKEPKERSQSPSDL